MPSPSQGFAAVDRSLGQLISLTGVMLLITQAFYALEPVAPVQPWWRALSLIAPIMVVATAVFSKVLPFRALKLLWIAIPAVGFLTTLLTFPAYTGETPSTFLSWEWRLAGPYLSFVVLWLPPRSALIVGVVTGFFPAFSGLLRYGYVPTAAAELIPIALTNFAFVVLFTGIRVGMNRFHAARVRAREAEAWSARAAAHAEAQTQFSQVVHDNVLASLSSALHFEGEPPPELRRAAQSALTVLEDNLNPQSEANGTVSVADTAEALTRLRDDFGWAGTITVDSPASSIPRSVSDALIGAAAEALRNAERHAGAGGSGRFSATIGPTETSVTVRDHGPGFDPDTMSPERLGVRGSILGRMGALRGGSAEISSAAGGGTEVRLRWAS